MSNSKTSSPKYSRLRIYSVALYARRRGFLAEILMSGYVPEQPTNPKLGSEALETLASEKVAEAFTICSCKGPVEDHKRICAFLEVVGASRWEVLEDLEVRVFTLRGRVCAIGHHTADQWFIVLPGGQWTTGNESRMLRVLSKKK